MISFSRLFFFFMQKAHLYVTIHYQLSFIFLIIFIIFCILVLFLFLKIFISSIYFSNLSFHYILKRGVRNSFPLY